MVNPNEIKANSGCKVDFDLFKLTSTKMSVSICVTNRSIVPEGLITELKAAEKKDSKTKEAFKSLNIDHYQSEFNKKQLEFKSLSYNLLDISGFALELLLGKKETKKGKSRKLYDWYAVNLNLGKYSINIETTNLNHFVQLLNHYSDTMLTSHISDFRPMITPMTDEQATMLRSKLGSKFGAEDEIILKEMRKHIVRDYFRLLLYTNLYRKYGTLTNLDVKRRIIWTFKRSSVMYRLITGKTPMDIILNEEKFFIKEMKYLEKSNAIQFSNSVNQGDLFDFDEINAAQPHLNNFQKLMYNIKGQFGPVLKYDIQLRVSFSVNLSLLKLDKINSMVENQPGSEPKQRLVKELDTNLNNCVFELKKPSGPLQASMSFEIESIDVRFREDKPNFQKSTYFNQYKIDEYIRDPSSTSP